MTTTAPTHDRDEVAAADGRLPYLPALDGLRTWALLAVLLDHAGVPAVVGGHFGVTVFFVLSGFLITALLLQEHARSGRIDLTAFWSRRARRLVPATLVFFVLTVLYLIYLATAYPSTIVGDGIASLTWVANWRFVSSGRSYGDLFVDPTPFAHLWSLAVEEQFYLVLPILLVLLLGSRRLARPGRIALVLGGIVVASSALMWLTYTPESGPVRQYYGTDTRVAELAVGALVAAILVHGTGLRSMPGRVRSLVSIAGAVAILGIVGAMLTLSTTSHLTYRGGLLVVALLAALVVVACTAHDSLPARVLSRWPLPQLGKATYGAYLFHWPVVLATASMPDTVGRLALRIVATWALALASYALVERPIRTAAFPPFVGGIVWIGASASAAALLVVVTTFATPRELLSPIEVALGPAEPPYRGSRPAIDLVAPGAVDQPLRVAVVGDSLAQNLAEALHRWAAQQGDVLVYDLSLPGCTIGRGGSRRYADGAPATTNDVCLWWEDPMNKRSVYLQQFDPDVVLIQDALNNVPDRMPRGWTDFRTVGDRRLDRWLVAEYRAAANVFAANGAAVVLADAVCADWTQLEHWQGIPDLDQRVHALNRVYRSLGPAITIAPLAEQVCREGTFVSTVEGVEGARPDGFHLAPAAADRLVARWLGPLLWDVERTGSGP